MRPATLWLLAWLCSGCMGTSLGEVRATPPLQTGIFQAPYDALAACVKERIETDSWRFGQPIVHSVQQGTLIRVWAMASRSTLFEVTFHASSSDRTTVDYRRSFDGHGTQDQAWAIIEQCAHRTPPAISDAGALPALAETRAANPTDP